MAMVGARVRLFMRASSGLRLLEFPECHGASFHSRPINRAEQRAEQRKC
jgi:hypothetical protein